MNRTTKIALKIQEIRRRDLYKNIEQMIAEHPPYTEEEMQSFIIKDDMSENIRETLDARGSVYGAFEDNASIAQALKEIWEQSPGCRRLQFLRMEDPSVAGSAIRVTQARVVCEGMDMILHKIARAMNGDPLYRDNFIDIAGYSQLVVDYLDKASALFFDLNVKMEKERAVQELKKEEEALRNKTDCCAVAAQPQGLRQAHPSECIGRRMPGFRS